MNYYTEEQALHPPLLHDASIAVGYRSVQNSRTLGCETRTDFVSVEWERMGGGRGGMRKGIIKLENARLA